MALNDLVSSIASTAQSLLSGASNLLSSLLPSNLSTLAKNIDATEIQAQISEMETDDFKNLLESMPNEDIKKLLTNIDDGSLKSIIESTGINEFQAKVKSGEIAPSLIQNKIQNAPPEQAKQAIESVNKESIQTKITQANASSSSSLKNTTPHPTCPVNKRTQAQQGIDAIIAACNELGLTSPNAIASCLAIAGGECTWISQTENLKYSSKERLKTLFKRCREDDAIATKCVNNPEETANSIYCNRIGNGNYDTGDGWKYRGRGMVQLTGKANYQKLGDKLGLDLVNNPDLANEPANAAKILVSFCKDRAGCPQTDPAFFKNACAAVGYNVPDIKAKKELYYEWFYGAGTSTNDPDSSNKTSAPIDESVKPTPNEPKSSDRITQQRPITKGFKDPNGKYPLQDYLGEPDTNRLARGITKGTAHQFKDRQRLTGALQVFDEPTWDQPANPYNAVYPYNHVTESESGHLFEMDDTPDNERVHLYHRKGTFIEIDTNGTQVNRIVGDGYSIIDRNGFIYIQGDANVSVVGNIKIICQSNVKLDVYGDVEAEFKANANVGVANDVNLNVGGNVNAQIKGNASLEVDQNLKTLVKGGMQTKVVGDYDLEVTGKINFKTTKDFNLKAENNIAADGNMIYWNSSVSSNPNQFTAYREDFPFVRVPPLVGPIGVVNMPALEPPPRKLEEITKFESPEDATTPTAQASQSIAKTTTVQQEAPVSEASVVTTGSGGILVDSNGNPVTSGNSDIITPIYQAPARTNKSEIMKTQEFAPGYRLTSRVKLDNLIASGNTLQKMGNTSVQEIVYNLSCVANNIIEPVYDLCGGNKGIIITSGFRSKLPPGGSLTSYHFRGLACDFVLAGKNFNYEEHFKFAQTLANSGLNFDKILLEYRDPGKNGNAGNKRIVWIHCQVPADGETGRKQTFTLLNDKVYGSGITLLT